MSSPTEADKRLFSPKFKRLAATAAAFGLLLAGLYAAGISLPNRDGDMAIENDDGSSRPLAVNTLVAQFTPSYFQQRSLTGMVKPRRSADLSFSQSGRIVRLLVDQGDQVDEGAALGELDTRRLTVQRDKLLTARDAAKAEMTKLIADSRLRSMEAVRAEVRDLKTQVKQLSDEIKRDADATGTPGDSGPSTRNRLRSVQQRLDALDATSRDPQVAAKQAEIAELEPQIAQLDTEIQQSTLRAPFKGVIAMRYVSDGILVAPSVRIMRIFERDALQVWVGLPADAVVDVSEGETYVIKIGDQQLEAVAVAIHPELDQTTRTRTVVFSLDEAASTKTLPGEVARIELERRVESPGFWLPITSLTRETRGLWSVYVVDHDDTGDQFVSRCYVEVVYLDDDWARVRGTLDDGAMVIADGTHRVVPGQQVQIVRTTETQDRDAVGGTPAAVGGDRGS